MDSYRLIVTEDRFNSKSSNRVLIKLLCEIFPQADKPNKELGFMYEETDVFPKEYFFNTLESSILNKISARYKVEQVDYPGNFAHGTPDFKYLGNPDFFPPKLL